MQIVRNSLPEKLKRTSVQVNGMVNSACNRHLEACDRMKRDINRIKVAAQKQHSFAKVSPKKYDIYHNDIRYDSYTSSSAVLTSCLTSLNL